MSQRILLCLLLFTTLAAAQDAPPQDAPKKPEYGSAERGIMVREAALYISPASNSARLGTVGRGREIVIIERHREFAKVFANVDRGRDLTGWIVDKGYVTGKTPNGDRIAYGEAVDSEAEASRRGGRKGADMDAGRLYYRTAEYFPQSPLAGEALYRAADIRWQLDRAEIMSRPSAKLGDPDLRSKIEDELMKEVKRKFSRTKWADLADFQMLDNKMCGDWQGASKCPEREAEEYEEYAREHPNSPKLGEALYEAARRWAALIEIYPTENKPKKVEDARKRARDLLGRVISSQQAGDWGPRAQALLFAVENGIPVYARQPI